MRSPLGWLQWSPGGAFKGAKATRDKLIMARMDAWASCQCHVRIGCTIDQYVCDRMWSAAEQPIQLIREFMRVEARKYAARKYG